MEVVAVYSKKNESVARERIDPVSVSFVLVFDNLSSCYNSGIFHKVQKNPLPVFQKSSISDFVKIKKPMQFHLLQKSKIHRLNPLT